MHSKTPVFLLVALWCFESGGQVSGGVFVHDLFCTTMNELNNLIRNVMSLNFWGVIF